MKNILVGCALSLLSISAATGQQRRAANSRAPLYDMRHVRWGMTPQQVANAEGLKETSCSSSKTPPPQPLGQYKDTKAKCTLSRTVKIGGVNSALIYGFDDRRLTSAYITPDEDIPSDEQPVYIFKKWHRFLSEKYGPTPIRYEFRTDPPPGDPNALSLVALGKLLSVGGVSMTADWKKSRTLIRENLCLEMDPVANHLVIDEVVSYIDRSAYSWKKPIDEF